MNLWIVACQVLIILIPTPCLAYWYPTGHEVEVTNEFVDSLNVSDDAGYVLKQHFLYCTNVPLCLSPSGAPLAVVRPTNPCCKACSCSDNCNKYGSCCPDVILASSDFSRSEFMCVRPQYKTWSPKNNNYSIYMKAVCSDNYPNGTIRDSCYDLTRNSNDIESLFNRIPVTSSQTDITYRNVYCGLCNLENDIDLEKWVVLIECADEVILLADSTVSLLKKISDNNSKCNLIFKPSTTALIRVPKIQNCDWGYINQCNQTELMNHYNPLLDKLCQSYTSLYLGVYRNIFCYLCNVNYKPLKNCVINIKPRVTNPYAFTALLDFSFVFDEKNERSRLGTARTMNSSPSDGRCQNNYKYDTYKQICRRLYCSPGFVYKNRKCKSAYTLSSTQTYEVFIKMNRNRPLPDTNFTTYNPENYFIHRLIDLDLYNLTKSITILSNNKTYFHNSEEHGLGFYLLAHIKIEQTGYHNTEEMIRQLISLGDNVNSSSVTVYKNEIFDIALDGNTYYLKTPRNQDFYPDAYTDPETGENLEIISGFLKEQTRNIRLTRVVHTSLCPLVSLDLSEFNWTEKTNVLEISELNLTIDKGYYYLTAEKLLICSERYVDAFAQPENLSTHKKYTSDIKEKCSTGKEDGNMITVSVSTTFTMASMICLSITLLTYLLFKKLGTIPGINNMVLSLSLLCAQTLFEFGMGQPQLGVGCVVLGALIHYCWLFSVVWMNCCTIHMCRVFAGSHSMMNQNRTKDNTNITRYAVYACILSSLPVIVNIVYNVCFTRSESFGYGGCACFISSRHMIAYTFALPIGVIIMINIILFIIVVFRISSMSNSKSLMKNVKERSLFQMYIKLSVLTGLTWVFGFLYRAISLEIFAYLFIILNAGQGVFILLAFIVNKRVLHFYLGFVGFSGGIYGGNNNNQTTSNRSMTGKHDQINSKTETTRL